MGRRFASQVHQQVSRLLRANFIQKEPVWYQAVLEHPPLTLPPKAPPPRTPYDKKAGKEVYTSRPLPIYYLEDDIRRQFFADHPFEGFRPSSLVEADCIEDPHPVAGEKWTRLSQRTRNPTPEDAIRFTLNLYQYQKLTLSEAYARAVAQYRALRSEHHISAMFAVREAEELGSTFGPSAATLTFEHQKKMLTSWDRKEEQDEGAIAARKRWKAIIERQHGSDQWTKGEKYVSLWQTGVRPDYMPAVTQSETGTPNSPSQVQQPTAAA